MFRECPILLQLYQISFDVLPCLILIGDKISKVTKEPENNLVSQGLCHITDTVEEFQILNLMDSINSGQSMGTD